MTRTRTISSLCEAHYGNARILQEQGRNDDARDYFEEVQANDKTDVPDAVGGREAAGGPPRASNKAPEWSDNFFSAVERQYLKVLFAVDRNGVHGYYKEFDEWRKVHALEPGEVRRIPGADVGLRPSRGGRDQRRENRGQEAGLQAAGPAAAGRNGAGSQPLPAGRRRIAAAAQSQWRSKEDGFDEFVIDANKAAEKKDWTAAAELFGKALAAATPKTDKKRVADARNAYVVCVHNQAADLYNKNQFDEAVELVEKLLSVPENRPTAAAPPAALFALNILDSQLREPPFRHGRGEAGQRKSDGQGRGDGAEHHRHPRVDRQGRGRFRPDHPPPRGAFQVR